MNKIIILIAACFLALSSCSYDDNELWDNVNDLQNTDLNVQVESSDISVIFGDTSKSKVQFTAVESYTISKPDGWRAFVVGDVLTIIAPSLDNKYAETEGVVAITALDSKNKTTIAEITVKAVYKTSIVTFEDENGSSYWSSLIDSPQYGGPLLYGDYTNVDYAWTDKESGLYSTLNGGAYGKLFWSGGIAVSNYYSLDAKANGGYQEQLTVYGTAGHNDSKNCAVFYGGAYMSFSDGVAKTIDHMYIAPTTYYYYVAVEGNELSAPVGKDESVWINATGYLNGVKGKTVTTYMIKDGKSLVDTWTKCDLSGLGKVDKVKIMMDGDTDNGYGFSIPAYFAIDDIAIVYN